MNATGRLRRTILCVICLPLAACSVRGDATVPESPGRAPLLRGVGRAAEPGISCSRAMSVAGRALVRLGYVVENVEPATPGVPGRIVGQRQTGWTPRIPEPGRARSLVIAVSCSDLGAEFEASTDEAFFRRQALRSSFSQAVKAVAESRTERPRIAARSQRGLIIVVEPQGNPGAGAEFGVDLPASGITAVQVRIDNRTERTYGFARADVKLVTQEGKRVEPLPLTAIAEKLGSGLRQRLEEKLIAEGDVAPGATRAGFVYVPASTYQRATILLTDRATGETEGFRVEF